MQNTDVLKMVFHKCWIQLIGKHVGNVDYGHEDLSSGSTELTFDRATVVYRTVANGKCYRWLEVK